MKSINLHCNKCNWRSLETEFFTECPNCQSPIEVEYEWCCTSGKTLAGPVQDCSLSQLCPLSFAG